MCSKWWCWYKWCLRSLLLYPLCHPSINTYRDVSKTRSSCSAWFPPKLLMSLQILPAQSSKSISPLPFLASEAGAWKKQTTSLSSRAGEEEDNKKNLYIVIISTGPSTPSAPAGIYIKRHQNALVSAQYVSLLQSWARSTQHLGKQTHIWTSNLGTLWSLHKFCKALPLNWGMAARRTHRFLRPWASIPPGLCLRGTQSGNAEESKTAGCQLQPRDGSPRCPLAWHNSTTPMPQENTSVTNVQQGRQQWTCCASAMSCCTSSVLSCAGAHCMCDSEQIRTGNCSAAMRKVFNEAMSLPQRIF